MTTSFLFVLLAIGFPIGALSGMLGIGGGVVLVPTLNFLGIPMHTVVGISISYAVFTSASGVLRHSRQGTIDILLALPITISAAVTVQVGAHFCTLLSENLLQILFGLLLILVASSFAIRSSKKNLLEKKDLFPPPERNKIYIITRKKNQGEEGSYQINLISGIVVGGVAGFISGMFGVGGGFLTVPLMVMAMHIPVHIAMGTSLVGVFFASTLGSIAHWKLGHIDFAVLLPITLAGIGGAQIGAKLMIQLPQQQLRAIFNILLLVISFYMLAKGIGFA